MYLVFKYQAYGYNTYTAMCRCNCPSGIASIRDCIHLRLGPFEITTVRDRVHRYWCLFAIVPIRNHVHLGSFPFEIVSIRDPVYSRSSVLLALYPFVMVSFGIESIQDCGLRDCVHLGYLSGYPISGGR